jgi:hypothetical protein
MNMSRIAPILLLAACIQLPEVVITDPSTDTDTYTDPPVQDPVVIGTSASQNGLTLEFVIELADGWSGALEVAIGQGATTATVLTLATDGVVRVAAPLDDPCSSIGAGTATVAVTVTGNDPVDLDLPLYGSTVDGSFVDAVDGLVVACGASPNLTLQISTDGAYRLTGSGWFTRDGGAASIGGWGTWDLHLGQYAVNLIATPYVFAVEAL